MRLFVNSITAIVENVDIASSDAKLVHWCYTEPGSPEHLSGKRVGDPCCANEDESFENNLSQ